MPPAHSKPPLEAFLEQYWKDREAGTVRDLTEYLNQFPGTSDAIAAEFLSLQRGAVPEPEDGSRLGPYRLIHEIGRGGQAVVWMAEDTRLPRKVALKVLRELGPGSEEVLRRFQREAAITSKLEHAGICTVYDAGMEKSVAWIAMRLVEGETVARKIATARESETTPDTIRVKVGDAPADHGDGPDTEPLGPSTRAEVMAAVELVEKVARALHVAHEAGVIHRDIKPGNIMVTGEGEPIILDFGLARDETADTVSLTQSGDHFGTPPYMSPEQITRQNITVDRRTDVWSLGVSLFEMLTLRRPYGGPTREATYKAILGKDPPDPCRLNRALPADVRIVIETALEKDLERRYQTAIDLAEDLRRMREHLPIHAKPVTRWMKLVRWSQRNPAVAALLALVLLSLSGGLAATLIQKGRADTNAIAKGIALDEWERLADGRRVEDLIREADEQLWPAVPERAAAMEAWLVRARLIAARQEEFRSALLSLRSRALPYSKESKKADQVGQEAKLGPTIESLRSKEEAARKEKQQSEERHSKVHSSLKELLSKGELSESEERTKERLEEQEDAHKERILELDMSLIEFICDRIQLESHLDDRLRWEFGSDARAQLQHDKVSDLVSRMEVLVGEPEPSVITLKGVERRLESARTLGQRTLEAPKEAWSQAMTRVASNPKYRGLKLEPQLGLIPLGADPGSTLEEFHETQTGEPPVRDAGGRLQLTEATALVFVLVPGGTFVMGAQSKDPSGSNYDPSATDPEDPPHDVTLSAFFLSKFVMTQGQWLRFVGRNPSFYRKEEYREVTLQSPVEQVSYDDCNLVLGRLGHVLPTESQWEYACRAGTRSRYSTGDEQDTLLGSANIADESGAPRFQAGWNHETGFNDGHPFTSPAGALKANAFGLHDMHGNVWEWCEDGYDAYGSHAPRQGDGLRSVPGARFRVSRGGSFYYLPVFARSAARYGCDRSTRRNSLGVRPARVMTP